jgi:hypothetical protein
MTPNVMHIVHKTLLKSPQKHCQTVFSRFLSMTIFIPAENTENPGQNSAGGIALMNPLSLVDSISA